MEERKKGVYQMNRLDVSLKNGKRIRSAGCPLLQLILWRNRLIERKTIQLPTDNGTFKVDGRAVRSVLIERGGPLSTDEAAACMFAEPYVHYRTTDGDIYQYSLVSDEYEVATRRIGTLLWTPVALPEDSWTRIGKDTLLHS